VRAATGADVERESGGDAPDLIGVEHLAREQRVGHLHQRVLAPHQEPVRALVVVSDETLHFWSILSAVSSL